MRPPLLTNRDLYLAVTALSKRRKSRRRSLEEFLLAVLARSAAFKDDDSLTLAEFYDLLAAGFTETPAVFDETWRARYDQLPYEDEHYAGWYATVVRQVVDLREMDERGTLQGEMLYFGVSSPRASHWCNFDPSSYLEGAVAGSLGGWESEDDAGRSDIPDPVTELDENGEVRSVDPQDLPSPTVEIPTLTWSQLKNFVSCGRAYE